MYLYNSTLDADLIVSRHLGALEWLAAKFGGHLSKAPSTEAIPVKESVTEADVDGQVVVGNLPLFLASKTYMVGAIEFDGPPPRGAEYGVPEMCKAGARVTWYQVVQTARHIGDAW
jgi:hypothetical protein